MEYQAELGEAATQNALRELTRHLRRLGPPWTGRWLKGRYLINRAFQSYGTRELASVPGHVAQALMNDPSYLTNRGVMSITLRAMMGTSGLAASVPAPS